jgi:hypothetical protein
MDADNIPAFAFHEAPDGTITWGSSWKPGPYAADEPVAVEYEQTKSGLWVPRQAWVRDSKGHIDMHDCDWIESRGEMYHHESGGGDPYVNGWSEPERLRGRMWIAEGVAVTSDGFKSERRALSDADLLDLGLRRVHGPTPAPFEDAIDGEVFWCEVCKDYFPDEDDEGITDCCCCSEQHHMHDGDLIVVADEDRAGIDDAGVYRPTRRPFFTVGLIGSGYLHEDALVRVADLPDDVRMDGYAAGSLCQDCAARVLADRDLPILGSEWSEDPEAMPDERREALLDAVRTRADAWIAGHPENRATKVHDWFASTMAPRFGLPVHEMRTLCDEAGYG